MSQIASSTRKLRERQQHSDRIARRQKIQILNPIPGGAHLTSLDSALRHVQRGAAEWVGDAAIRFTGHQRIKALESALAYDRVSRSLRPDEIRRIPVIQPERLLRK